MTPSGRAGLVFVVHRKLALAASLFVLGVPHASLGVVVVKKVAQAEPLHLQAVLQDPADGTHRRRGEDTEPIVLLFEDSFYECKLGKNMTIR